ncbi:basic helix-loop-helix (bHLH) DNA-bindingsuperfamily protein [Striga asiatica]|uniref:Basic helix-loop-helix (BHLH) DNA-bindingsuperfamily protein n=1 Tax=Striga asiatica TaxID=4170 RepID=A0A5A7PBD1_STRAF|nr:basic helix-loop-helix (bHLH) DNA-bindingsuperfamily protein [Striga asiatica]
MRSSNLIPYILHHHFRRPPKPSRPPAVNFHHQPPLRRHVKLGLRFPICPALLDLFGIFCHLTTFIILFICSPLSIQYPFQCPQIEGEIHFVRPDIPSHGSRPLGSRPYLMRPKILPAILYSTDASPLRMQT